MPGLIVDDLGPVTRLTLDRPAKLNAMDQPVLDALAQALDRIEASSETLAVLVTATGGRAFSAGADIAAWGALEPLDMWRRWIVPGNRLFERLARLRQPTVAAIDGIAYGGGLELALACDIRIASERSRMALPETGIGTVPGWGGARRLVAAIGWPRAKHMILTGEPVDAATALAWGLVTELHPAADLPARGQALATALAERAPVATQAAKRLVDEAAGQGDGLSLESFASAMLAHTEDGREGTAAFKSKRSPEWRGR
jgi:enoyl-CoA hydratase/carnithine racemase